jgi:hypothetical protein
VRCFTFLQGVPEVVIPDNLRSAVNRAHRYEPELSASYLELARHYGVAVIPKRWILARLRNRQFYVFPPVTSMLQRYRWKAKFEGKLSPGGLLSSPALEVPATGYLFNPAETPRADPHAGCCGGRGLDAPGYPIMRHLHSPRLLRIQVDLLRPSVPSSAH